MASHDVVSLLLEDHEQARGALKSFEDADRSQWSDQFPEIADTLARHEAAEEAAVYPILSDEIPGGAALAAPRLEEQSEARGLLGQMKSMTIGSDEFAEAFAKLRSAVLEHASEEESEIFPLLRLHLSEARLTEMGEYYAKVKASTNV
jgi:hemerythrin superfamily protein